MIVDESKGWELIAVEIRLGEAINKHENWRGSSCDTIKRGCLKGKKVRDVHQGNLFENKNKRRKVNQNWVKYYTLEIKQK